MQTTGHEIEPEESRSSDDFRENPKGVSSRVGLDIVIDATKSVG
jgi:hypothetical protein